jgi:hypothetical protein
MLTDVNEMNVGDVKKMMRYMVRTEGNLLVLGSAGLGKTEMGEQSAKDEDCEYTYLNLSVMEAPDLVGLPFIKNERTAYAPPHQFPIHGQVSKKHVLILDELDKASPDLQNPMLELIQKRSINGTKLGFSAVIATANLPDEGAFSKPISHALANRFSIVKMTPSYEHWRDWAVLNGVNPLITGFLSKNTDYLLKPAPDGDDTAYCHASPRAWTYASRDLQDSGDDVEFQTMLVAGRVGTSAAAKFRVWLDHYRHIEPLVDDLVLHGKHPQFSDGSFDKMFVCSIASCQAIVNAINNPKTKNLSAAERKKKIHETTDNVMKWVVGLLPEVQIGAVKSVFSPEIVTSNGLLEVTSFMDVFKNIRKAFDG